MDTVLEILNYEILEIPVWSYLASFGLLLLGFIAKWIATAVIARVERVVAKSRFMFDDLVLKAVEKPIGWACVLAGLWGMVAQLPFPEEAADLEKFVFAALKGFSIALLVWTAVRVTDGICAWWAKVAEGTETKLDDQIVPIVRRVLKIFLYLVGGMLILQNLGYSVSSLLAGVGLGGMALALASKDTVANVFGSLVIFMDQPFQIGDWIKVGDIEGTVEEVGLRTTRVRTFANSLYTVPNSTFTTVSVNNWSKMAKRRIKMTIGVTYDSTPEQIEAAVEAIRQLIRDEKRIRDDYYLVYFDNFGPSSLDIFIYCFTETTVWADFLAVKQDFMLAIMRTVSELGLGFAFPTQSIHVESLPGEPDALTAQRPE